MNYIQLSIFFHFSSTVFAIDMSSVLLQKNINENSVRNKILSNLSLQKKRKLISEIISKINSKNFKKNDFYKLSEEKNVGIQKIELKNQFIFPN